MFIKYNILDRSDSQVGWQIYQQIIQSYRIDDLSFRQIDIDMSLERQDKGERIKIYEHSRTEQKVFFHRARCWIWIS